jgi:hypothetical protein
VGGEKAASTTIRDLGDVVDAELPGESRILEAAQIKATHPMAYADSCVPFDELFVLNQENS